MSGPVRNPDLDPPCKCAHAWTSHSRETKGCSACSCRAKSSPQERHWRYAQDRKRRIAEDPTIREHGRYDTYKTWGCRCDPCLVAYMATRKKPVRAWRPVLSEDGLTATVPLTRGLTATIDAADVDLVSFGRWHAVPSPNGSTFYARNRDGVRMHQLMSGLGCDHINRDGLDNRRSNLRPATARQQNGNKPLQRNNTSGVRGVYRNKRWWYAQIGSGDDRRHLGAFSTLTAAQAAYEKAAIEMFGDFYVPASGVSA